MTTHDFCVENLSLSYGEKTIINGINLEIANGKITVIIGANGSGKSTLLRSLSRLLKPDSGCVLLDGQSIYKMQPKKLARLLGLLPQSPLAPEGITVADLVGRGRYPHRGMFARWSQSDDEAITEALLATKLGELADTCVDELSGGQRQRVWIAMALAQQTDILLLDEPTTFLDINHQIEVLDLLTELNQSKATTIIMVLHDLNLACRYADYIVAISDGRLHSATTPQNFLTPKNVYEIYNLPSQIIIDPVSNRPLMIPIGRHHNLDV